MRTLKRNDDIMKRTIPLAVLLLGAGLSLFGCKEPIPVELVDDPNQGPIEVVNPPPAPMPGLEIADSDSAGIVPSTEGRFFAHFLVAGARYDGDGGTSRASLARAILFDRSAPIELAPGRTAYASLDAGLMGISGTPLWKVDKRVRFHGGADTLLGVQYVLFNTLLGGFRYEGGTTYRWAGTGNGTILPFARDIAAPPELVVQNLSPSAAVRFDEPLRVRWTGGGPAVHLVISLAGQGRIDSRPILHLRLGPNRGGIAIPERILALLPRDRDRFVFTFFSRVVRAERLEGYPDDVLLEALTAHSVLVHVSR